MDPNEGVGAVVSTQNLSDLQNYLVTFNKEIEGGDPTTIPVITDGDGSDPEAASIDLDDASMAAVQAQLASLTGSISDITGSPQELIMTSVGDGLEAHEGKVIRIVSLGQDGSILSLGDGSQMQILNEEALQGVSEIKDSPVTLESLSQSTVMTSDSQDILDVDGASVVSIPTASIPSSLAGLQVASSVSDSIAMGGEGSSMQSQLVAVAPGEDITADALQTLAVVPSEGENGEVNYILIVSQPDGANKVLVTQGISLDMNTMLNLKEAGELTEEMPHLESHILTHSGEKPFKCDECDHAFRQKQLLKRHKNLHHTADYQPPTPRDKNHDCSSCDKSFAHRGNLLRHMAQHEGGDLSEDETSAVSGEADHILHGDLMQDWREGKLGNAPQVVIVHPDGRIEEVTPKLQVPPDRSALELQTSLEDREGSSGAAVSTAGKGTKTASHSKLHGAGLSQSELTDSDDDDGNQREAGTQVELESDSEDEEDDDDGADNSNEHDTSGGSQEVKDVLTPEQLLHDLTQSAAHGDSTGLSAVLEGGGFDQHS
nr:hypothetical protein BaRGS_014048 [Batillaria attramentaria]